MIILSITPSCSTTAHIQLTSCLMPPLHARSPSFSTPGTQQAQHPKATIAIHNPNSLLPYYAPPRPPPATASLDLRPHPHRTLHVSSAGVAATVLDGVGPRPCRAFGAPERDTERDRKRDSERVCARAFSVSVRAIPGEHELFYAYTRTRTHILSHTCTRT